MTAESPCYPRVTGGFRDGWGSRWRRIFLPPTAISQEGPHIDDSNEVVRAVFAERGRDVLLVDLDREMTGEADHVFVDLARVNNEGNLMKAEHIGHAIVVDLQRHCASGTSPRCADERPILDTSHSSGPSGDGEVRK